MIIDRDAPMCRFDLVPQLKLELDPELAELDRLLDDDVLFAQVTSALARRAPRSLVHGRHSTPVEVVLRMLVVRRLSHGSYEATEHFVSDSLVLRQFCRRGFARAPDDSTLIRWAGLIRPATLERLNDHVVALAQQLRVTRGRKLRTDGTVVETTIHHPSARGLLVDGVRVLGRLVGRAKRIAGDVVHVGEETLAERLREARRLGREIGETARRRGDEAAMVRQEVYRRLGEIVEASLEDASRLVGQLRAGVGDAGHQLQGQLEQVVPLVEQVVDQTARWVFGGESVPASEKLVSLFEPHSAIIGRGKADRAVEFGRKVWLDEVDGGIISRYHILVGNPSDDQHLAPTLAHHQAVFGHPPDLLAGDRGVHSAENEFTAQVLGVTQVCLPRPGARSPDRQAHERQEWFRQGQRFRAGIEGQISLAAGRLDAYLAHFAPETSLKRKRKYGRGERIRCDALSRASSLAPILVQSIHLALTVKESGAGFPVHPLDTVVAHLEGVRRRDLVDDLPCPLLVAQGHLDPDARQGVGELAEQILDGRQPGREQVVDPGLDRVAGAQVVDVDLGGAWPMYWIRPSRCFRRVGFQGRSRLVREPHFCGFSPSEAASVPASRRRVPSRTPALIASRSWRVKLPVRQTPERLAPAYRATGWSGTCRDWRSASQLAESTYWEKMMQPRAIHGSVPSAPANGIFPTARALGSSLGVRRSISQKRRSSAWSSGMTQKAPRLVSRPGRELTLPFLNLLLSEATWVPPLLLDDRFSAPGSLLPVDREARDLLRGLMMASPEAKAQPYWDRIERLLTDFGAKRETN